MKLNKVLSILAILLVLAIIGVTAISAADNGTGSIDANYTDDAYTSDSDVNPEVYYATNGSGGNGRNAGGSSEGSVNLDKYPTSNPLIVLLGALTLAGISYGSSRKF